MYCQNSVIVTLCRLSALALRRVHQTVHLRCATQCKLGAQCTDLCCFVLLGPVVRTWGTPIEHNIRQCAHWFKSGPKCTAVSCFLLRGNLVCTWGTSHVKNMRQCAHCCNTPRVAKTCPVTILIPSRTVVKSHSALV